MKTTENDQIRPLRPCALRSDPKPQPMTMKFGREIGVNITARHCQVTQGYATRHMACLESERLRETRLKLMEMAATALMLLQIDM